MSSFAARPHGLYELGMPRVGDFRPEMDNKGVKRCFIADIEGRRGLTRTSRRAASTHTTHDPHSGKIQPARLAVCLSRYVCLTMCFLVSLFNREEETPRRKG